MANPSVEKGQPPRAFGTSSRATLLLAVGVVLLLAAMGAVLGLRWPAASNDTQAKQELASLGALVAMDVQGSRVSSLTLSTLKNPADLDGAMRTASSLGRLRSLNLNGLAIKAPQLARIAELGGLNSLSLKETGVGDEAMPFLSRLNQLESLHLNGTSITNSGLAELAKMRSLKVLDLSGVRVSAPGDLARLPHLEWLILRDLRLAEDALRPLAESPSLGRITLRGATYAEADLEQLVERRPDLTIDQ